MSDEKEFDFNVRFVDTGRNLALIAAALKSHAMRFPKESRAQELMRLANKIILEVQAQYLHNNSDQEES